MVLLSGNGSNCQTIIDACGAGKIHGEVVAVVSNKSDAYGLNRAIDAGIAAICVDHKMFTERSEFDTRLKHVIDAQNPDLVVLAGFMRVLGSDLVQHYHGRMLNIHPSLLPKYKGLHTHRKALEAGDSEHGCSVHFVTPELDGGPVIAQRKLTIAQDDTAESLQRRVQVLEHEVYPEVVGWFCDGRLSLRENIGYLDDEAIVFE